VFVLATVLKPRIKEGMQDGKRLKLYETVCPMLAQQDYDQISVAQITRAAGISVGAFYERFADKDEFLDWVVSEYLCGAQRRAERELDPKRWEHSPAEAVVNAIIEEMRHGLHGPGAGVVRAALKRGHLDRQNLSPFCQTMPSLYLLA
jgi:AcrR family transcriptional regulator